MAGVAALMLSAAPGLSASELRTKIMESADSINITMPSLGAGLHPARRLNAYAAVRAATTIATLSGDFTGNGLDDIARVIGIGYTRTVIEVERNTGNGFLPPEIWWQDNHYSPAAIRGRVVAGDFNGNGRDDIAAFRHNGGNHTQLHVWTSLGFSSFHISTGWQDTNYSIHAISGGRIVAGDFNGDGRVDIAALRYNGGNYTQLHVWTSLGNGTFHISTGWSSTNYHISNISGGRIVAGDFTGDGRCDIAVIRYNGGTNAQLQVWQSLGWSSFHLANWWSSPNYAVGNVNRQVVAGRFNQDNIYDILAVNSNTGTTQNHIWLAQSNHTFNKNINTW